MWTPYLTVILAACWTGATPVQHTVDDHVESTTMAQTQELEGVLSELGNHLGVETNGDTVALLEPADGVWRQLLGCRAKIVARDKRIERAEIADGNCPYKTVGPVATYSGTFSVEIGAPGTKMAGSTQWSFVIDGVRYGLTGDPLTVAGRVIDVRARKLVANMAYAARSTDQDLWILEIVGD
jgi:hypothetical protein